MKHPIYALILGVLAWLMAAPVAAERVKDLASVSGVRDNQLIGYGLVVGLDGTGDSSTSFTSQSMKSMLAQLGVVTPPGIELKPKNVAAVMLHATLPPFAKPGQKIDVTVSSAANAKSLRGGTLLMSPLKGADGQIYAIAQGNLIVGGLGVQGADGSKITVNIPSAGRIPNGATVERAIDSPFGDDDLIVLNLNTPDFTTASRLVEAINQQFGQGAAHALDGTSVQVSAPRDPNKKVAFAAALENVTLKPDDAPARVIINSRSGTVVINGQVRVGLAAVSHGNLVVTISEDTRVSQPQAFANGRTVAAPDSQIDVSMPSNRMFMMQPGVTLDEIVRRVNEVGAAPGDLVAILEALKEAGALKAELIVI